MKVADGDYQNQELCKVLKKMGVKITGVGQHHLNYSWTEEIKRI